jgi:putative ABC transport system permease protein
MFSTVAKAAAIGIRSLPRRPAAAIATMVSMALVVVVLLGFLAMGNGYRDVIANAGQRDVAIILRDGATTASSSLLSADQIASLSGAPGIGRMVSPETVLPVALPRAGSAEKASMAIRGVVADSPFMTRGLTIEAGRAPRSGSAELFVGRSAADEFGLTVGSVLRLAGAEWRVAGIFGAGGSLYASEVRADLPIVQSVFGRGAGVQSARVLLDGEGGLDRLDAYLRANPHLGITAKRESDYFRDMAANSGTFIQRLGWPLSLLMALGALAGAGNAMYASVDGRSGEIVTLRTLGFGKSSIFGAVVVEGLVVTLAGAALGVAAAGLLYNGWQSSAPTSGFSQIMFRYSLSWAAVAQAVLLAFFVGLTGSILPAVQAARLPLALSGRE